MDYDNNATKVGLLSNKEKTFKSSDVHDADIELQEVNHQEYLSFEEAKQQTKFQKKTTQPVQPSNHDSDILFQLDSAPLTSAQPNLNTVQRQQTVLNQAPHAPHANPLHRSQTAAMGTSVSCQFCGIQQVITDCSQPFQCFRCRRLTQVIFSLFICGYCKLKVQYQVGVSQMIKCTNCFTVNLVPPVQPMQQQANYQQQPYNNLPPQVPAAPQVYNPYEQAIRPPPKKLPEVQEIMLEGDSEYVPIQQKNNQPNKEL